MYTKIEACKFITDYINKYEKYCISKNISDESVGLVYVVCNNIIGIYVVDDDFAPYKCVSIEIRPIVFNPIKTHKSNDLIYFYYDEDSTELSELKEKIDEAFCFANDYKEPDLIKKVNHKYKLKSDWRRGIHADDRKSADSINSNDTFICIGTFAQYCIITDGKTTFKILDDYLCCLD